MDAAKRAQVRERADDCCEYCGLHAEDSPLAPLHIEHIRPRKHGGTNALENLALACVDCNLHKGPNLTGIDPETDEITVLYNPRIQVWGEHFRWEGVQIVGLTETGRTTIVVLSMNSDEQLGLRSIVLD